MVQYAPVTTEEELKGILDLQQRNLAPNLTAEEMKSQGFLTVSHTLDILKKMHAAEPSLVVKDGETVVAYALAMTTATKVDFPILEPLFDLFGKIEYKGKKVTDYHYMIAGQTCIDKKYRGKGILPKIYAAFIARFKSTYDFAITEIATKNLRSRHAHEKIGFVTVHEYTAPDGVGWMIVILPW
jgi:GNAT superfamily N-acetyltransferase